MAHEIIVLIRLLNDVPWAVEILKTSSQTRKLIPSPHASIYSTHRKIKLSNSSSDQFNYNDKNILFSVSNQYHCEAKGKELLLFHHWIKVWWVLYLCYDRIDSFFDDLLFKEKYVCWCIGYDIIFQRPVSVAF